MSGLTFSVAVLFGILLVIVPKVQGETIQCYHCTNCPTPFDENQGKKLANCNYCRTTITYDGEPRRVEKECVSTCAESDRRRDGRGMVVQCCKTPLCNPAPSVLANKQVVVWSAVLVLLVSSVWNKFA
ncbi:CD59 protein [Fasciola gigantica]|uniref:CD59 protein n=1 Tax=Fasciola gigantica TaxID=46835 RepID=A0A504ZF73_FASGI|nr:CD59 protein [Fasciola gigantica]